MLSNVYLFTKFDIFELTITPCFSHTFFIFLVNVSIQDLIILINLIIGMNVGMLKTWECWDFGGRPEVLL